MSPERITKGPEVPRRNRDGPDNLRNDLLNRSDRLFEHRIFVKKKNSIEYGIFLRMNFLRDSPPPAPAIDKGTRQFDSLNFNTAGDETAMQMPVRILVFQ